MLLFFAMTQAACPGGEGPNVLIFPFIVTIDSSQNRVFVIDNSGNRLNLVNAVDDQLLTKGDNEPLLSDEDPILYPIFPTNAAVADMGGSVSRIFVIGSNQSPTQQISVLDYPGGETLSSAPISPIDVPAASSVDLLVGLAVDPGQNLLFVTNASTGMLHFFNTTTGLEDPASPLFLGGQPARMAIDLNSGLLAVADGASSMVTFVDLNDLSMPLAVLDVGVMVRSLGMATNQNGSVLFLSGELTNVAKAFLLNRADLSASAQIFELTPPSPTDPIPDPLFITGSLNLIAAGNLTDGRMAAFYTQSSGDLLILDLSQDLGTLSPNVTIIQAVSGEGIAGLGNGLGQLTKVYFASPSSGILSIIDASTNNLLDQIN